MDKNDHLEKFHGQCSILISEESYRRFYRRQKEVGRLPDENNLFGSNYVSTSADINKALNECNGDVSKLEESLGLSQFRFGEGPLVRIDINNPEAHGLRVATGTEPGANEFYNTPFDENGHLPNIKYADLDHKIVDTNKTDPFELTKLNGQYWDQNGQYHAPNPEGYEGKTSGGLDEAVVNRIPNTPQNISYTKLEGFSRGNQALVTSSHISDGHFTYDQPSYTNTSFCNIAGAFPKEEPYVPTSKSQIAGTTPDKKQDIELPNITSNSLAGQNLAESTGKKAGAGVDAVSGIM